MSDDDKKDDDKTPKSGGYVPPKHQHAKDRIDEKGFTKPKEDKKPKK